MSTTTTQKIRVAIVGAGSSGLAAARVFSRNGIEPTILEKNSFSGGVWKYQEGSKTSPMYRGLRTNLPKEIMAFREFPFPTTTTTTTTASTATNSSSIGEKESKHDSEDDYDPSFLTHDKVLDYLQAYQANFDLTKYIQYGCEVQKCEILKDAKSRMSPATEAWPQIRLEWKQGTGSVETKADVFDVVCVCNGHYAKPFFAKISGLKEHFKGTTMHSVAYDNPADFQGQRVLCVGGRASGSDIAREMSAFAKHVYLSDSTCQLQTGQQPETQGNITAVPLTREVHSDGSLRFENCTTLTPKVDCIIFCTGYDYDFPFLSDADVIQSVPGDRRVLPLYEQLWHAHYPTLSFLGIPHSVVPFPEVEFQAEAIHAQLLNNLLPPLDIRVKSAEMDANSGGCKENGRVQDTHYLGGAQWDYCRTLAKLAGIYNDTVDNYIATNQAIYEHAWEGRNGAFAAGPDTYREICYRRDGSKLGFTFRC